MSSINSQNTTSSARGSSRRSRTREVQGFCKGATRSSPRSLTRVNTQETEARLLTRATANRGAASRAVSRQRLKVPEPPRTKLQTPANHFLVMRPPTHLTRAEYEEEKELHAWSYSPGSEVELGDKTWMKIDVTMRSGEIGHILLPKRFYGLWRRLLWGAEWFEKIWGMWEDRAKDSMSEELTEEVREAIEWGRRASAMRLMSYLHFRRRIVQDLLRTDLDGWPERVRNPMAHFHLFVEFGIREYRSWMFFTTEEAKREEEHVLALDPTAPENLDVFDAHGNAPYLNNPPKTDDWMVSPWPLPYGLDAAEFMERLIVSTIEEPRENIPMDREGGKYLGTRCEIWESGAQRLYPLSSHFLEFFREHGTSPLGDPEKYCSWLLDIREKGVPVDWTWEWHAVSTRCGYHNQDAEIAYVDYTVQDLDDKRISRQDFYKKLFHVDDDHNQDRRSLTPRDGETDEE